MSVCLTLGPGAAGAGGGLARGRQERVCVGWRRGWLRVPRGVMAALLVGCWESTLHGLEEDEWILQGGHVVERG